MKNNECCRLFTTKIIELYLSGEDVIMVLKDGISYEYELNETIESVESLYREISKNLEAATNLYRWTIHDFIPHFNNLPQKQAKADYFYLLNNVYAKFLRQLKDINENIIKVEDALMTYREEENL